MAQIEIIENKYNTICDTYGCNNIGTMMVGKPGENIGQYVIMCDECLQNIINAAPLDMVMNREGLREYLDIKALESDAESVGKALEGDNVTLDDLSFKELRELASERNITVPFGTSRDKLVELLSGDI